MGNKSEITKKHEEMEFVYDVLRCHGLFIKYITISKYLFGECIISNNTKFFGRV